MDKKIYTLVSLSEQEIIIKELINLINSFPDMPKSIQKKGILFYDMYPDNECIGLASLESAIIFQRFIAGSYIGQYRFRLHYRYSTKNSNERIQKQSLLSTIGEWLQRNTINREDGTTYTLEEYPSINNNINIISILSTDRAILVDKSKSGYEDSIEDFILKYHRKV